MAPSRLSKNHAEEIDLLAYCLMPNHFHLLVYQEKINSMNHFLRSVATKYAMFFNRKYDRTGHLFEGIYKAVLVETEEQLIYLSKYIHRNPVELLPTGMILEGVYYQRKWLKARLASATFNVWVFLSIAPPWPLWASSNSAASLS